MQTKSQIQQQIFNETGIKTSVKKLSGSMKQHLCFSPMLQNGIYPQFPFEWRVNFIKQFATFTGHGNYQSATQLDILKINIIEDSQPIKYSKESKPKTIEQMIVKGWGSKNSQLRLDKAAKRHADKIRRGVNTVRYY